jgi:outer membrane protein assembly factor BamA
VQYIAKVPALLQGKGYITASVDNARFDSIQAIVHLYLGQRYEWASIKTSPDDAALLEAVRWNEKQLQEAPMNFAAFQALQQRMITYLEETGYPFAQILLDSVSIDQNKVSAVLHIDRGPLYKIDSIRVFGDARIDNEFLQRYLDIKMKAFIARKAGSDTQTHCRTAIRTGRAAGNPYLTRHRIGAEPVPESAAQQPGECTGGLPAQQHFRWCCQ